MGHVGHSQAAALMALAAGALGTAMPGPCDTAMLSCTTRAPHPYAQRPSQPTCPLAPLQHLARAAPARPLHRSSHAGPTGRPAAGAAGAAAARSSRCAVSLMCSTCPVSSAAPLQVPLPRSNVRRVDASVARRNRDARLIPHAGPHLTFTSYTARAWPSAVRPTAEAPWPPKVHSPATAASEMARC